MQTKDKKQLYLDMQEHPEKYSDTQIEAMMDDLDKMPDVDKAWHEFETNIPMPQSASHYRPFKFLFGKVAAIFIGVVLISGIAFAAIHLARMSRQPATESAAAVDTGSQSPISDSWPSSPVRFDDARLDHILAVVSAHYGKVVSFSCDEAKGMKFILTWKPDAPLADFIDGLNLFDGLQLTIRQDTIFVDIQKNKEDEE